MIKNLNLHWIVFVLQCFVIICTRWHEWEEHQNECVICQDTSVLESQDNMKPWFIYCAGFKSVPDKISDGDYCHLILVTEPFWQLLFPSCHKLEARVTHYHLSRKVVSQEKMGYILSNAKSTELVIGLGTSS